MLGGKLAQGAILERIVGTLWLDVLATALLWSAWNVYHQVLRVEEFPLGCDSAGYLIMTDEIRAAATEKQLPDFHLDAPQARTLIEYFRTTDTPVSKWSEAVALYAHRYFQRRDAVGAQYPPGTALALAAFPRGSAVHGISGIVIGFYCLIGILLLVWAGVRRIWLSAGLVILALYGGLMILGRIGNSSYSINVLLLPLLLAVVFSFAAIYFNELSFNRWSLICAGLAGVCLGLAILVRLPVIFLCPGLLLLFIARPLTRRDLRRAGVFLGGSVYAELFRFCYINTAQPERGINPLITLGTRRRRTFGP